MFVPRRVANTRPKRSRASIYDELAHIVSSGVTAAELERAKHQIEAHFILSRERTLDQALLLGQIETLSGLDYIDNYLPSYCRGDFR